MEKTTDDLRKELDTAIIREKKAYQLCQAIRESQAVHGARRTQKRTHHLCNIAGAVESIFPDVAVLTKTKFYMLMEKFTNIPEVNKTV